MADRRENELHNLVSFLQDAQAHGAHVFTPQELHPGEAELSPGQVLTRNRPHRQPRPAQGEIDLNNMDFSNLRGVLPHLNLQEVLYHYQGHDYQCLIVGSSVYHHRLIEGIGGARPFRREPPTVAPWLLPTAAAPLEA